MYLSPFLCQQRGRIMAENWREKLLDWFGEDKGYEKQRRGRQLGRIEELNRNVLPRVAHHYPRKDASPLQTAAPQKGELSSRKKPLQQQRQNVEDHTKQQKIDMREKEKRRKKQNPCPYEGSSGTHKQGENHHNQEKRRIREKFTGVDFRASDVPSPVYGFRQRHDLFGRDSFNISEPVSVFPTEELSWQAKRNSDENRDTVQTREDIAAVKTESAFDIKPKAGPASNIKSETTETHASTDDSKEESASSNTNIDEANTRTTEIAKPDVRTAEISNPNGQIAKIPEPVEEEIQPQQVEPSQPRDSSGSFVVSSASSDGMEQEAVDEKQYEKPQEENQPDANVALQSVSSAGPDPSPPAGKPEVGPSNDPPLKAGKPEVGPSNAPSSPAGRLEAEPSNERPSLSLLAASPPPSDEDEGWIHDQRGRLAETLEHFNVQAEVVGVTKGPAVTRFEVQPAAGVKVNKITKLSDDLKLSLAARDIRIEAPIPGKSTVGIEIPNPTSTPVSLREMIESEAFQDSQSPLTAALGLDIAGTPIITDLQKMPHGLISGATGSGKSVCINSLLISLLYKAKPEELKMVLIDPKVVELAPFKDIPHLAAPVINDPKEASRALKWAVDEMERRYECLAEAEARDIARYNRRMKEQGKPDETMPYIVVIIDELADLMMVSPQEVEDSICRIAQKARACGIHLVLATQRPSVDVITGLIKANIPTRIAFSVSSQADSRTILDKGGAEKLLGHGDMLFVENGAPQSVRVQGNFVSDDEIDRITNFVRSQGAPDYLFEKEALKEEKTDPDSKDELFEDAGFFVFEQGMASTSSLQRHFRIGYNRAARLIDSMEASGMISEAKGSKPRQLLMSEEQFLEQVLEIDA